MPDAGFVYGPVPSRRLGASLGVDVVPLKHCPFDCIYCQLGPTRSLASERSSYFPVGTVLADVERRLRLWPPPEVITIAGSGEPTLFSGLGDLITGIKALTDLPVVLLTNGALFIHEDVRREALAADLVLPSLDAGDEATFQKVNRPAPGFTLAGIVEGLAAFRSEYSGQIWLEVMVIAGLTEDPEHIARIAALARLVAPDRIQLNTPVRPTHEPQAAPVPRHRLEHLAGSFEPSAEVIADYHSSAPVQAGQAVDVAPSIEALLARRPCRLEDLCNGLGLHANEVVKALTPLVNACRVHRVVEGGTVFYRVVPCAPESKSRESARWS